jgi:trigger factor
MKSSVKKLENSHVEIIVDFESNEWKEAQEKAFKKLAGELEIKGFRKGKAPEKLAREKINPNNILTEALDSLVQPTFSQVLSEHNLVPMARPSYDVPKFSDNDLQVKFTIVVAPEVEIGAYKDLEVGHKEIKVSDEEIDLRIVSLREENAELVLKEDAAAFGDTVVLDFDGYVDGKQFDGGKAENYSLELGSGSFIPGFEDQVVGHKAGDEFEVKVTFPEKYVEHLAGKDVTFKVKIHEIKTKKVPELSDEFVADLSREGVNNVAELREDVKKELTLKKENDEKNRYLEELLKKLRETSKVELAEEIVADEAHNMQKNLEDQISQNGLDLASYCKMTNTTEEALHQKFHDEARRNITNYLIIEKVGEAEKIGVTEEALALEIKKLAEQYKMEEAKVREILGESLDRFKADIKQRNIFDYLLSVNK